MKRIIISAAALIIAGAGLMAQNLDPTVVVTNTYAQQAGVVEKPSQLFEMPDSVTRFNLDFDYSALSVPYHGAYEFKPYLVEFRPTVRPSGEGRLYVSGGAGYGLHPELTAIWTPVQSNRFRLNLYGDHNSYFGKYRNITNQGGWFAPDGSLWSGSRMHTLAGANGLLTWTGGRMEADVHYRNVWGSDNIAQKQSFNAVDVGLRVESDPDASIYYIVKTGNTVLWAPMGKEVHSVTSAGIGTRFRNNYLRLGVLADIVSATAGAAGNIAITPRYLFEAGDFSLDLGLKVSFMFRSEDSFYNVGNRGFIFPLFPDVRVRYCVVPDKLALYAEATGGHIMNTYGALVENNPFLASFAGAMDASVERVNVCLGGRGNVSSRLYYDLKVGYALRSNALLWGFTDTNLPAFGYASIYDMFYTDLSLGWKGDRIDIDSHFLLQKAFQKQERLFAPALLQGTAKAVYDWGERIRAGVTFDGQTERTAIQGSLPGYVDLGLLGDIQMTRSLGFWLKVGNLLNQSVQRVPFHAERGIYFTVGARLNL